MIYGGLLSSQIGHYVGSRKWPEKGQFREHISSRGDDLFKPDLRSFIGARGKYPISDRRSAQRAWAFGQFADFQTERCKLVGELL